MSADAVSGATMSLQWSASVNQALPQQLPMSSPMDRALAEQWTKLPPPAQQGHSVALDAYMNRLGQVARFDAQRQVSAPAAPVRMAGQAEATHPTPDLSAQMDRHLGHVSDVFAHAIRTELLARAASETSGSISKLMQG